MNVTQIKETYSMKDILARCNIRIHRGDVCQCPFHAKDHTPSMKVYEKSFYCFGCNKGGDFIKFVMLYQGLSFPEACKWISGEELERSTKRQIAVANIRRKAAEKEQKKKQTAFKEANKALTGLWQRCLELEPKSEDDPFSDEWAKTYNKWQLCCYNQEICFNELEAK